MRPSFARTAFSIFLLSLVCTISPLLAKKKSKSADSSSVQHKRAVHALNRLTFGPQPGDVEHVAEIGVDRWIDLQLHPEKISDRNLESRLAPFRTLHMSSKEILQDFPDTMTLRLTMDGRLPMPTDPERRAVYQVQIARLQQKQDAKDHKAGDPGKRESAEKESTESSAPKDAAPAADNTKSIEEIAAAVTAGLDSTDEATEKSGKEESNKGNKESVSESDAQSNHAGAKDSDSI